MGLTPGLGSSPGEGHGRPLQWSQVGYSPWGRKETQVKLLDQLHSCLGPRGLRPDQLLGPSAECVCVGRRGSEQVWTGVLTRARACVFLLLKTLHHLHGSRLTPSHVPSTRGCGDLGCALESIWGQGSPATRAPRRARVLSGILPAGRVPNDPEALAWQLHGACLEAPRGPACSGVSPGPLRPEPGPEPSVPGGPRRPVGTLCLGPGLRPTVSGEDCWVGFILNSQEL